MAAAPVKSQPLHNFPLSFLKWSHRCRRPVERRRSPPSEQDSEGVRTSLASCSSRKQERGAEVEDGEREREERAWNLRPRRAAKASEEIGGAPAESVPKSARLRGLYEGHVAERKNLWIALSREEIEEDVYAMTGGRPVRRPKKRAKTVQKQLDSVFPGLLLVGITADAYRVDEAMK